jgi:integrase
VSYSVRIYPRRRVKKNGRKYTDWYVIVSRDGKDIETTRASPNTEAGAKALANRKRLEFHVGNYVPSADDMTFSDVAKEHLAYFEARTQGPNADKSERSTKAQESILRIHLLPRFGHLALTKVAPLLPAYVDELKAQSPSGTVHRRYEAACAVFRYAQKRLGFPDLLQNVHVELPPKRTRADDEIIKFEEFGSVLAYLDVRPEHMSKLDWLQSIVRICLAGLMGLRVGEIAGADCEDMDLDGWRVHVNRQLHPGGKITAPKYRSKRSIDMDTITHKALADYRDFLGVWSGPLLRGPHGERFSNSATVYHIEEVIRRAGLVDDRGEGRYSSHILRHFAGSFWISQGVPVDRVSRQLGHRSYDFTHKTYIHQIEAFEERGRTHMQALGNAFPGAQASLPPPDPVPMLPAITAREANRVAKLNGAEVGFDLPADAPQWLRYAVRLFQDGWSVEAASDELGMNWATIYHAFQKAGLPTPIELGATRKPFYRTNTDKSSLTH